MQFDHRVDIIRLMDTSAALLCFQALSQETRLATFRLLVQHEPTGLAAGELARQLGVPHNTLSTHLARLEQAGLVESRRESRSIIYRANLTQIQHTIDFLAKDCCAGHPDLCFPDH